MFLPPKHIIEFVPEFRSTQTPWQGLTPIAAWLVRDLGPGRIVELGSYRGDSFFAFLQEAEGDGRIRDLVAIDSWEGDQHTGSYGSAVHQQFMAELQRRGDPRARAIRGYFSDAVAQFEDGTIDLLHIDGAHDYASVSADLESWLPKMAPDGVILFHDTMVRHDDFGVWQLWAELEQEHPGRTFNFEHSNGLGILCLGHDTTGQIRALCGLSAAEAALVREALRIAGQRVTGLTSYEYGLLARSGTVVPEDYVFSRGEARETIEALSRLEALQDDSRIVQALDRRIERLFRDQAGDVFSALRPMLTQEQEIWQGALEDQLARKIHAILEEADGRMDMRIERLFRDQAGDVFSALRPMLSAMLEDYGQGLHSDLDRDLPDRIRTATQVKNDAQDDAIIGIGRKVEAHEEAIQELASYLRQVFQHPLFQS